MPFTSAGRRLVRTSVCMTLGAAQRPVSAAAVIGQRQTFVRRCCVRSSPPACAWQRLDQANSSTSDEGHPITALPPDSPYAHSFYAISVRVWEKVSGKAPARRAGPLARSDVRLYDPKGARQRDALRCGMVLKKPLERRAHRVSLLGR